MCEFIGNKLQSSKKTNTCQIVQDIIVNTNINKHSNVYARVCFDVSVSQNIQFYLTLSLYDYQCVETDIKPIAKNRNNDYMKDSLPASNYLSL